MDFGLIFKLRLNVHSEQGHLGVPTKPYDRVISDSTNEIQDDGGKKKKKKKKEKEEESREWR